jgi:dTMP kinase
LLIWLTHGDFSMFITFEGIEGSGKSLQVSRAEAYLKDKGIPSLVTREPGGTEFGKSLRRILLETGGPPREPLCELLLYLGDRYQDATRAYQGAARGVPRQTIDSLTRLLAIRDPDATILLDLEPEAGLERARMRNHLASSAREEGRFEAEDLAFHTSVRLGYLDLAKQFSQRFQVVPAGGTPDEVFSRIAPLLRQWLPIGNHP